MNSTHQEANLRHIFEAARRAHERGHLEDALRIYKKVADQDPYYPGIDAAMRALESEMTHAPVSDRERGRLGSSRPPRKKPTVRRSRPAASTRRPPRQANPYILYGIIAFLPAVILTVILASLFPLRWGWISSWLVANNVVTFFVYGYDKKVSSTRIVRVPERILLLEVLLGAFVGAPLARSIFRHKTQKPSFRRNFYVTEIISITWIALYYLL